MPTFIRQLKYVMWLYNMVTIHCATSRHLKLPVTRSPRFIAARFSSSTGPTCVRWTTKVTTPSGSPAVPGPSNASNCFAIKVALTRLRYRGNGEVWPAVRVPATCLTSCQPVSSSGSRRVYKKTAFSRQSVRNQSWVWNSWGLLLVYK